MKRSNYTHRIVINGTDEAKGRTDGDLCSEHTSEALAEKALGRLLAMSNGKQTRANYRIEKIEEV